MSAQICNTINKIGEQLNCPICLGNFSTPKRLFCLHTFCQQCLERLPVDPKHNLSCPTCQSPCELPSKGVAGLPTAFFVENVTEVQDLLKKVADSDFVSCKSCGVANAASYCKQCNAFTCTNCSGLLHSKIDPFHEHVIVDLGDMFSAASGVLHSDVLQCSSHDQPLELYCHTCQQLVCTQCCLCAHKRHEYCYVADAYADSRRMIERSVYLLEQNIPKLSTAATVLYRRREEIVEQNHRVRMDIERSVSELINHLTQYRTQLTNTTDFVLDQKLKIIDQQIYEVKATLSNLEDCYSCMKEVLTKGTPQQVLSNKQRMVTHSSNLLDVCFTDAFVPLEEADLDLVKNSTNTTSDLIGQLKYHLNLIPNRFTVKYQHLPIVGRESTVTIALTTSNGSPLPPPSSSIHCCVIPPNSQQFMECRLVESPTVLGHYDLTFTPFVRGDHQIRVTVRGNEIIGTNPAVPVSVLPEMRGMPVNVITDIEKPWGIDVNDSNQLCITEWDSGCTLVTNHHDLKKQRYISERGTNVGQFSHPSGVCVTNRNTFIVSDTGNNRIQEITKDGKCVKSIGSKGSGPLQFLYPRGIAIHKDTQQIYVADDENHRIQVLNADFTFAKSIGTYGCGRGQFNRPRDITFDSSGNFFVTDIDNHRIQKFSPNGECLDVFGSHGSKPGELNLPVGITTDDYDNLYITEGGNRRVSVFSGNGEFLCCFNGWGGKHCSDQLLSDPREITFDKKGFLYVCDWSKGCVMVF